MRLAAIGGVVMISACAGSGERDASPSPTPTPWACFNLLFARDPSVDSCSLVSDCSIDGVNTEVRVACEADADAHDCRCYLEGAQVGSVFTSAGGPDVCPSNLDHVPLVNLANEACDFRLPQQF